MRYKQRVSCQGCLRPRNSLVSVQSGWSFRVVSPPESALVTRELAEELECVLECFGRIAIGRTGNPAEIFFRPGIFGHHRVGRAVDIYEVNAIGIHTWKQRWDAARQRSLSSAGPLQCAAILKSEGQRNMGWLLYKTLQIFGRWSQPYGYPVQLFGPWTRTEGPWKYISDFLLRAHGDHIHVAK